MRTIRTVVGAAVAVALLVGVSRPADALLFGSVMDRGKKAAEEAAKKKAAEAKRAAEEEAAKKADEAKLAAKKAIVEIVNALLEAAKKKLEAAMPWVQRMRARFEKFKDEAAQKLGEAYDKLQAKLEEAKEKGKEAVEKVAKKIAEIQEKIMEKVNSIAGKVMGTFKDLFERAKAFGEHVMGKVKDFAGSVQEKVQYVINTAKEKAHAAMAMGQELANRVTNQLKEGWDFVSTRAKELAAQAKEAALKLHAKFEALKGEKLADLQRMFMAARLKLEALNVVGSKGSSPQPEVATDLALEVKKYIGRIVLKMKEHGVE